jgi:hypothetical protein
MARITLGGGQVKHRGRGMVVPCRSEAPNLARTLPSGTGMAEREHRARADEGESPGSRAGRGASELGRGCQPLARRMGGGRLHEVVVLRGIVPVRGERQRSNSRHRESMVAFGGSCHQSVEDCGCCAWVAFQTEVSRGYGPPARMVDLG